MQFNELIDKVLASIQISDVVGKYVELTQRGQNFMGLCPFHQDHHPSLSVSNEKRIYKCFSCGAAGNAVTFIQKYKEVHFKEALIEVAGMAGLALPEDFSLQKLKKAQSERDLVVGLNQKAAAIYHQFLLSGSNPAHEYLRDKRRLSPEMIEKFYLGYAKDAWEIIINQLRGKAPDNLLLETGLFAQGQKGLYDRFRHKVIFPIFDLKNDIVAFGSRVLDDSKPKYINSPETKFFKKKELLYGLNFAVEEIRQRKSAYVVEGYMDTIVLHQHGFTNTVAPLGTAFSAEHVTLLSRYAPEAVLLFDGDEAGLKAASRSVGIALAAGYPVKVVTLPYGMDPDDFIRERGVDALSEYLMENSVPWDDFLIRPVLEESDLLKRRKSILELLKLFSGQDSLLTHAFLDKLSGYLRIAKSELEQVLNKLRKGERPGVIKKQKVPSQKLVTPELELVFLLLNHPFLYREHQDAISTAFFSDTEAALPIFEAFLKSLSENGLNESLLYSFLPEAVEDAVQKALSDKRYQMAPEKQFQDLLIFLRLAHIKEQKKQVMEELQSAESAENWEKVRELLQEGQSLGALEEKLEKERQG